MHTPFARSAMNAVENIAAGACYKSAAATFVWYCWWAAAPCQRRPIACLVRLWPGLTSLPAADRRQPAPIALADVEATGLSESSTAALLPPGLAPTPSTLHPGHGIVAPMQLVQQIRDPSDLRRAIFARRRCRRPGARHRRGGKATGRAAVELEDSITSSPALPKAPGLPPARHPGRPHPRRRNPAGQRVFIMQSAHHPRRRHRAWRPRHGGSGD